MKSYELKAGNFICLLRLLNSLQQADIADYLGTSQSIVAQLENNKYRPNSAYIHKLSQLFFINPNFLGKLAPPAFSNTVAMFNLRTALMPSMKLRNQADSTIRDMLPALLEFEKVTDLYAWHTGDIFDFSRKFSASLFIYYSKEFKQIIIVKVVEDSRNQFYDALCFASDKLSIDYQMQDISYGDFESFFSEEIPHIDDDNGEQFREIFSMTDIPDQDKYMRKYLDLTPNELYFRNVIKASSVQVEGIKKKRLIALDGIIRIMKNYDISTEDIEDHLRNQK